MIVSVLVAGLYPWDLKESAMCEMFFAGACDMMVSAVACTRVDALTEQ